MSIIKTKVFGLSEEIFGAKGNEDFVFNVNGRSIHVSNEPTVFSALQRLGAFPFKGNIEWKGKTPYVSDKEWE
jgi:hypothetical protein